MKGCNDENSEISSSSNEISSISSSSDINGILVALLAHLNIFCRVLNLKKSRDDDEDSTLKAQS
jgi:hypothetical protein